MESTTEDIAIFEEDMMKDAIRELLADKRMPNEITITMAMKLTQQPYRYTYNTMEKAVKSGLLKKRIIVDDGNVCGAYSPADGTTWRDVLLELRR